MINNKIDQSIFNDETITMDIIGNITRINRENL